MKTFKLFLFAMFMLFASNVMANPVSGESSEPANAEVVQNAEDLMLTLSNAYDPGGHYEAKCWVVKKGGGSVTGNYTYEWSIEGGDRSYVWPYSNGPLADVSVYYTTAGRAIVHCNVYTSSGALFQSLLYYIYF